MWFFLKVHILTKKIWFYQKFIIYLQYMEMETIKQIGRGEGARIKERILDRNQIAK